MALSLQFTIAEQSGSLGALFTDTTGTYASDNTGGWGSPNPSYVQVVSAYLTIYTPDPATLLPSGSFVSPPVNLIAGGYPVTTLEVMLLPVDFGQSNNDTKIPDGVYTFVLDVTTSQIGVETENTATVNQVFLKQTECCINNMMKKSCKCGKFPEDIMRAKYALWASQLAINCNNLQDAADNLLFAKNVCLRQKCGNCGC